MDIPDKYKDVIITDVIFPVTGGIAVGWSSKSLGFGTVYFFRNSILELESECMSTEFCQVVMAKLIETCKNNK